MVRTQRVIEGLVKAVSSAQLLPFPWGANNDHYNNGNNNDNYDNNGNEKFDQLHPYSLHEVQTIIMMTMTIDYIGIEDNNGNDNQPNPQQR